MTINPKEKIIQDQPHVDRDEIIWPPEMIPSLTDKPKRVSMMEKEESSSITGIESN